MTRPFFSIGITTYNRHDLLRQSLRSILSQTCADFEVIVGNDYTAEQLTGATLGIDDPRIRFVNYPQNLQEIGNMNALLGLARGRYFTWLFDDDLYEPDFLQTGFDHLERFGYPDAFFSSYRVITGTDTPPPRRPAPCEPQLLSGGGFLKRYSANRPDVISTCGLIRTDLIGEVLGGMERLSDSTIGLYSEYLLLVRCGLLERIVFLNSPLVLFRAHAGSWGEGNQELEIYPAIGCELIRRSHLVLGHPQLAGDRRLLLAEVCRTHLFTYYRRAIVYEKQRGYVPILSSLRYRLRYLREVWRTVCLYASLTGAPRREAWALLGSTLVKNHIAPPVWDTPPASAPPSIC